MTTDWFSAWEKTLEMANAWAAGVTKTQEATLTAATRHLELMTNTYARLWGQEAQEVLPADRRFKGDAWRENPAFDLMKQIYLITARWMVDMTDGLEEASPDLHKRLKFWTQQYADAMSPTNFAATNPEVLQEIVRTGGTNVVGDLTEYGTDGTTPVTILGADSTFTTTQKLMIPPSNSALDQYDWLGFKTTSVSGSVVMLSITVFYHET